jgi:hypothetical protein
MPFCTIVEFDFAEGFNDEKSTVGPAGGLEHPQRADGTCRRAGWPGLAGRRGLVGLV